MSSDGPTAQIVDTMEVQSNAYAIGMGPEHTFYVIRVKKGKGEAKVDIENPEYVINLDRSKGTRLGLKLDVQVSKRSLFIKEVVGGLAFTWNTMHAEQKVRPGDRIVRVNKAEGDAHALMEECKKTQPLEIELRRGSAVPIAAGLHAIVKTPFGNLREGQQGDVVKVDEDGDALVKMEVFGNQWVCRQDYDKFTFEDSERFYLKRYGDFKDLYAGLKAKVDNGASPIKVLPEIPADETFGFRRTLSSIGMSSFMQKRQDGLQKYLNTALAQVELIESETVLAEFFGNSALPEVATATKDILKQRLEMLVAKHRKDKKG
jgi:hypothetical protein